MHKPLLCDLFSELSLSLTEVSLFHEMIRTKLYMYMYNVHSPGHYDRSNTKPLCTLRLLSNMTLCFVVEKQKKKGGRILFFH